MQRILLAGANGATGRHVVEQALAAGHDVTAFVRRRDGLPDDRRLRVVVGDVVGDAPALAAALHRHDALISALGNGLLLRTGRRPKILGRAARTIVTAMTDAGVARLALMLSYGSAATAAAASLPVRALGATVLRHDFADLAAADAAVTTSTLDWTVCHFGALTDGPRTDRSTVAESLRRPAHYRVPRADLAAVLLEAAGSGRWRRRRVVVSGPERQCAGVAS